MADTGYKKGDKVSLVDKLKSRYHPKEQYRLENPTLFDLETQLMNSDYGILGDQLSKTQFEVEWYKNGKVTFSGYNVFTGDECIHYQEPIIEYNIEDILSNLDKLKNRLQ